MRLLVPISALAAIALFGFAAHAQTEDQSGRAPCADEQTLTAKLVSDARDLHGIAGRADILIGDLDFLREPAEDAETASGTVIFVKNGAGWRALMPQNWENEVGLYSGANGALAIVTQHQVEGPGQSFTFVRSDDGFKTATCALIPFPAALNQPQWNNETLELHDLDFSARGRGALIASAALERQSEKPHTVWFSYATRDNGRSWKKPVSLSGAREVSGGLWAPATRTTAANLIADLKAYARGR